MFIFVGLVYSNEDAHRVLSKSTVGLQNAADNYQWGIIRGIHAATGERVHILNSVPMGSFPKYNKILLERGHVTDTQEAFIQSFGYLNLPVIKQLRRKNTVYRSLKRIIKKSDEPVTVIVYSLYNPYLKALSRLKERFNNFNYILIVPDLPGELGIESTNLIKRNINRVLGGNSLELSGSADGYVLLTEQMKVPMEIGVKPYTVVEGICNNSVNFKSEYRKNQPPTILYTGALDKALGLDVLIDAFEMLPSGSATLALAGQGQYSDEIKRVCKKNKNIQYLGYLPKDEIHELQRSADVLVNPRSAQEEYVKYSFPSKTMEYLSTGVPVVMNKLPGIPDDYDDHIFYTESSNSKSLAEALQRVLKMDEQTLLQHGISAARFIEQQKSSVFQARKVIELIERVKK